jgi:thioredoxin reductase
MHHDVVIVGGSFAGLAAALYLARARKTVCIIDGGQPRNRFAAASHGLFAQDGSDPQTLLATMRGQVLAYPTVRVIGGRAVDAARESDAIRLVLADGSAVSGDRLLLAFGVSDVLPDLPGLAERWGRSVLHCPYCHGYELGGGRLGVLNLSPASLQQALLVSDWGPTTFFADGAVVDAAGLEQLLRRNVAIAPGPISELVGEGPALSAILFAGGRLHPLEALFVAPRNRLNSDLAMRLGCRLEHTPLGHAIVVDEARMTSVALVYAAGDITRAMHNITFACSDGVMAAMAIHRSLL